MADSTISPNMNLIVPTVGQDPGPDWANNLNASLSIIDQHNHSSGQGVQVTPSGLNINADLPFGGNNATLVKTVNFQAQVSSLAGTTPNLGCVYVAGNELYYNDEAGNVVAITNNGTVNAGAGSITGLPSGTASASYSSGAQTFIWQSATNTPANMDGGSFIFRNVTPSSNGATLSAPNALAGSYQLFLPLIPAQTNVMTLDTSGNMGSITYDAVGQGMTSVGANAIASQITIVNPTGANALIASSTKTVANPAGVGGVAVSTSCGTVATSSGTFTAVPNLAVTITTSGRPVMLFLQGVTGASSFLQIQFTPGGSGTGLLLSALKITNNTTSTDISTYQYAWQGYMAAGESTLIVWHPSLAALDTSVNGSAGTYTYVAKIAATSGTSTINEFVLVAYELT